MFKPARFGMICLILGSCLPVRAIDLPAGPYGGGVNYDRIIQQEDADYVVTTWTELKEARSQATAGETIFVPRYAEIEIPTSAPESDRLIPANVTLASDRGLDGSPGGLIRTPANTSIAKLFQINGANVRITGLRIQGPTGAVQTELTGRGILTPVSTVGLEIDNNELFDWPDHAVSFQGVSAHIHNNFFHHNQKSKDNAGKKKGTGYGVNIAQGASKNVLIENNVFDYGRHAVSTTGVPGSRYVARHNIVLNNFTLYAFDSHANGSFCIGDSENNIPPQSIASSTIVVEENLIASSAYLLTQTGAARIGKAIHLDGRPIEGAWVIGNWFADAQFPLDDNEPISVTQNYHPVTPSCNTPIRDPSAFENITMVQNRLPDSNWLVDRFDTNRSGDFNGDGLSDLLSITANAGTNDDDFGIRVFDQGSGDFLPDANWGGNTGAIDLDRYFVQDMNNDGMDDIVSIEEITNATGFYVWESLGSQFTSFSQWETNSDTNLARERYQFGDFNGDGFTDLISIEPDLEIHVWTNSSGNGFNSKSLWATNGADYYDRFKVGDFNGDGLDDVISFEPDKGLHVWISTGTQFLPHSEWETNDDDPGAERYQIVDIDGDGDSDVLEWEGDSSVGGSLFLWESVGTHFLQRVLLGFPTGDSLFITVDPNNVGSADVVEDPLGAPVSITNPVSHPLGVAGLAVGDTSVGELLVNHGGSVNVTTDAFVGRLSGSTGDLTVTSTGSSINVGVDLFIAPEIGSIGRLAVADGAQLEITDDLLLGYNGGQAELTISQNAVVDVGDETFVGRTSGGVGAASTLNIQDGGTLNGENSVRIGLLANSEGHVNLTGVGTQLNIGQTSGVGELRVGEAGTGTLSVDDSASVTVAGPLRVGVNGNADGSVTVDNGTLTISIATVDALIGEFGTGSLTVTNGGLVTFNDDMEIGLENTGDGTVTVGGNGSAATLNVVDGVGVGVAGTGTLNVLANGTATMGNTNVGQVSGSTGTVLVDGASAALNVARLGVGGTFAAAGGTGAVTINGGDLNVTNELTIWGTGTINLSGGRLEANEIDDTHGGAFNFDGGDLTVDTFTGTLVQNGGTLTPGSSPGTTIVTGDYTMNSGVLEIEIGGTNSRYGV